MPFTFGLKKLVSRSNNTNKSVSDNNQNYQQLLSGEGISQAFSKPGSGMQMLRKATKKGSDDPAALPNVPSATATAGSSNVNPKDEKDNQPLLSSVAPAPTDDSQSRRLVYLAGRTDDVELELEEGLANESVDMFAFGWVPKGFLCPLSGKPMRDPVITSDGHSYERMWIQARFLAQQKNGSPCPCSPLTNAPLPNYDLVPNHALKKSIVDFALYQKRMRETGRESDDAVPVVQGKVSSSESIPQPTEAPQAPPLLPTLSPGSEMRQAGAALANQAMFPMMDDPTPINPLAPVFVPMKTVGFHDGTRGNYVEIEDQVTALRVQDSQKDYECFAICHNPMQNIPNELGVFASFRISEASSGFNGPTFGVGPGLPPDGGEEINDFLEECCWRIEFAGSVWFRCPLACHESTHDWNRRDLMAGDIITIHVVSELEIVVFLNDELVLRLKIPRDPCIPPLPYPRPMHAFFCVNGLVKEVLVLDVVECGLPTGGAPTNIHTHLDARGESRFS